MAVALNFLLFQIGWFACVLGASSGRAWLGTATALAIVAWHLARTPRPGAEAALLAACATVGFSWDSVAALAGLTRFAGAALFPGLAPHWMVALWLVFATTLNGSLRWLQSRPWLASVLGAIGGPFAYAAGARLGALELPRGELSLAAQALAWALIAPVLVQLAARVRGARAVQERVRV